MYEGGLGIDGLVDLGMHYDDIRAVEHSNDFIANTIHNESQAIQESMHLHDISLMNTHDDMVYMDYLLSRPPVGGGHADVGMSCDVGGILKGLVLFVAAFAAVISLIGVLI